MSFVRNENPEINYLFTTRVLSVLLRMDVTHARQAMMMISLMMMVMKRMAMMIRV